MAKILKNFSDFLFKYVFFSKNYLIMKMELID